VTCPPEAWYCYYLDFPGLEFTGDSSLVFYTIRLTPLEDYEIDGVRYLTASGCINYLNAGIYRDVILAQTGQSVLPPLVIGMGLISIGTGISILLIKRKKKQK
jgi:LPXTG-motif cell wall-anchored protein